MCRLIWQKNIICSVIAFRELRWYNIDTSLEKKGEIEMNACALKPIMPFVTRNKLGRTPATEDNRKMIEFMDSHNFSFDIDVKTKNLECKVTEK